MSNDRLLNQYEKTVLPAIIRIFSPVKVLIFGSRVNGTATKDSDIDVIIVAETFAGISFVRRMSMVMKSARFKKHVDYLCYTPEEFERLKNTSGILKDAVSSAIEVPLGSELFFRSCLRHDQRFPARYLSRTSL